MEREPVLFLSRDLEKLLDGARGELGAFVGSDADDLAFVKNASTGVSTVVRSLDLQPGDELLTTSHAYNACHNALRAQERRGVRVVSADVPFPIRSPAQVVDAVLSHATPRTKLALIDHRPGSGLVDPERLAEERPGLDRERVVPAHQRGKSAGQERLEEADRVAEAEDGGRIVGPLAVEEQPEAGLVRADRIVAVADGERQDAVLPI